MSEDIIETLRRIQCSDAACGNLRIAMGMKLAIYEIEQLQKQRDEARFTAAYQYAKHHNGDVQTLMDNFCELKGWQKIQFFVGDDDHAKEGL